MMIVGGSKTYDLSSQKIQSAYQMGWVMKTICEKYVCGREINVIIDKIIELIDHV